MASRADFEMLNSALMNVGDSALKRKQLTQEHESEMQRMALESQLRDVQEKRYDAQTAHFQNMEDVGSERNQILAQTEADRTKIAEEGKIATQKLADSQGALREFAQTLRANRLLNSKDPTKGMSQDDATKAFQGAMDNLPKEIHDQMLQNPNYGGLYSGKIDFGSIPEVDSKGSPIDKQPTSGSLDETITTIHHPEITEGVPTQDQSDKGARQAKPANVTPASGGSWNPIHWGQGAHPAITNAPAETPQPAWDEVIKKHIASGGSIVAPSNPQGAVGASQAPQIGLGGAANGKVIKDPTTGQSWNYLGSMADPSQDTNPANWKLAQ